ncbi:MAG: hypothetical protein V4686_02850 [Patescibacteria group bacterium]
MKISIDQANRLTFTSMFLAVALIASFVWWKLNKPTKSSKNETAVAVFKADPAAKKKVFDVYAAKFVEVKKYKEEYITAMRFTVHPPDFFDSKTFLQGNTLDEEFETALRTLCAMQAVLATIPDAGLPDLSAFMERMTTGKETDSVYGHPIHDSMLDNTITEFQAAMQIMNPTYEASYLTSIKGGDGVIKTITLAQ